MKKTVSLLGSLTRETGGLDAYRREFSMVQWPKLFWHTVEETILHLHGLSVQGFWQLPSNIAHLLCVLQLLHEAGMLLDSWNAKGLGLGADSVDEIIVRYCCRTDSTLDIRGIAEGDGFVDALKGN